MRSTASESASILGSFGPPQHCADFSVCMNLMVSNGSNWLIALEWALIYCVSRSRLARRTQTIESVLVSI